MEFVKRTSFYLSVTGAVLLALVSASVLTTELAYKALLAAALGFTAFLLMKYADRSSRKTGRDDRMKTTFISASILYELLLFLGVASTAVITENPEIGFIALAGIALAESLDLELTQQLKSTVSQDLGRNARVLVLVASTAAYHFQPYYLFYGVALVFLIAAYDSLRLIHQIREEL